MKLSEHLRTIHSSLGEILDQVEALDEVSSRLAIEEAALKTVQDNRIHQEKAIEQFKADWENDKRALKEEVQRLQNDRAVQLKRANDAQALAQEQLNDINDRVKKAEALLSGGLSGLRK